MTPPRPLDQDPPLILARWYRQEHRAPWDGSWDGTMLHTTEGGGGLNAAENGARYNATRDSVVSCHVFCDDNSTVQSVPDEWVSFSAGTPFNDRYRMVEICGYAAWTPDDWHARDGLLSEIAWNLARHVRQGVLRVPFVFCWAEDLCHNPEAKGIVTCHAEATRATNPNTPLGYVPGYPTPYSKNDHTDPGFGFYPRHSDRANFADYPIATVFAQAEQFLGGDYPPSTIRLAEEVVLVYNSEPYPQFKEAADGGYIPPDGKMWPVGWVWWELVPSGGKRWLHGEEHTARYDWAVLNGVKGLGRNTGQLQGIPDYKAAVASAFTAKVELADS